MYFIFFLFLLSTPLCALELSQEDSAWIGGRIFQNECGSDTEKLVWWNAGEEFASLGIAHFIWYPKDKTGPYRETFRDFIAFMRTQHVQIPAILEPLEANPWPTRAAFLKEHKSPYQQALRTLLKNTVSLQATYLVQCFEKAIVRVVNSYPKEIQPLIQKKIYALTTSKEGRYALLDYANFKGDGTLETERYQGMGWGLKQVLEEMPVDAENSVAAFAETAKQLLQRRVANAPAERRELRWLPGWINRLNTYCRD